jgi:hypothetical protein
VPSPDDAKRRPNVDGGLCLRAGRVDAVDRPLGIAPVEAEDCRVLPAERHLHRTRLVARRPHVDGGKPPRPQDERDGRAALGAAYADRGARQGRARVAVDRAHRDDAAARRSRAGARRGRRRGRPRRGRAATATSATGEREAGEDGEQARAAHRGRLAGDCERSSNVSLVAVDGDDPCRRADRAGPGDSSTQDEGRLSAPFGCAQRTRSLREGSAAERGRQGSSRQAGLRREDEREVRNAHGQAQIESNRVSAYPAHAEKLTRGVLRAGCLLLRECEGVHGATASHGGAGWRDPAPQTA